MKVVAINGSPRKGGNTENLLYWNLGYGRDKGEVANDTEAARNMADLGQNIAWLGAAIHDHAQHEPAVAAHS